MAREQRNGGVARVREALDDCAARMRRGEGLDTCLAHYPEYADELRPMLEALFALRGDAPRTPVPPVDLSRGRERMLAAAAVMRAAEDDGRAQDRIVSAELDRALDGHRSAPVPGLGPQAPAIAGESVTASRAPSPAVEAEVRALLLTLDAILADVVTPPATDGRLEAGRRRFLAAAAVMAESSAVHAVQAGANGAAATPAADVLDALDAALADLRSGADVASVVAAHAASPEARCALDDLLRTAAFIAHDAVEPPPMNGARELGRAHLVAAAKVASEAAREGDLDAAVAAALDAALLMVGRGASVEAALAACSGEPSIESAVKGLLAAAEAVQADVVAPPIVNGALERGRRNLLAAAVVAHEAERVARTSVTSIDDALDAALQRIRDGASIEEALAATDSPAFDVDELRRMILAAEALRRDVVPVPSPALGAGRERMLDVAARAREQREAVRQARDVARGVDAPVPGIGSWQGVASMLGGALAVRRPRVAVLTLAVLAAFMLGNAALTPVSARALPGDGLYLHKMIQRQAKLIVSAVVPEWHERVRSEISAESIEEVQTLQELAREADVRLEGELRAFEEHSIEGDVRRHGILHVVRVGDDGVSETVALTWSQPPTVFDLPGGYDTMAEVPVGTALGLQVRTGAESPLALFVRTQGLEPRSRLDATPTFLAPTQEQETPAPETATSTPPVTPTDLASPTATSTAPISPTLAASPTTTVSPTAAPAPTDEPSVRERPHWDELLGVVVGPEAIDTSGSLLVKRRSIPEVDGTTADNWIDVRVEIAAARASASGGRGAELWDLLEVGRTVKLRGRYEDEARRTFVANRLLDVSSSCILATAVGQVERYAPGVELVLTGGTRFALGADVVVEGDPRPGAAVSVDYESCAPLPSIVRRIVVETPAEAPEIFAGQVSAIVDGRTFALDDTSRARRFIVRYDPAQVVGEASVVEVGQRVRLEGVLVDPPSGVVEVRGAVVVTSAALPPTPTFTPSPTPTSPVPTPTDDPITETPAASTPGPEPPPTAVPDPDAAPPSEAGGAAASRASEPRGRIRR